MAVRGRVWGVVVVGALLGALTAHAEILVMQGPNGRLLITNLGTRSGYHVIARHREFYGSSGLGLRAAVGGDPARFEDAVREAAVRYALEASLVKAVIRAESNFDPTAISPKGAMGLMQLMPDTARMHQVRDAFDPTQNITGGARHLRYLMDRYEGKLDLVLAAYNAGTKPVDDAHGIPRIAETQEYVRRVRLFHAIYRNGMAKAERRPAVIARAEVVRESVDAASSAARDGEL